MNAHRHSNTRISSASVPRHIVTLCSPSRTECGYCHGDRLTVLVHDNPHPSPRGEPRPCTFCISQENHGTCSTKSSHSKQTDSHTQDDHPAASMTSDGSGSGTAPATTATADVVVNAQTTSDAYALHFETISSHAYLTLIDRGWRRSGKLLYLPRNWSSCCPAIPIRLETAKFEISKSQRKILVKFQRLFSNQEVQNNDDTRSTIRNSHGNSRDDMCNNTGGQNHSKDVKDHKPSDRKQYKRQKYHSFQAKPERQNDKSALTKPFIIPRSCPNDSKELLQCRAKEIVLKDTSLIPYLQNTLMTQVNQILLDLNSNVDVGVDVPTDFSNRGVVQNIQDKLSQICSWKCTKVSKPMSGRLDPIGHGHDSVAVAASSGSSATTSSSSGGSYVVNVTLSNTVCPSLHGMTRGKLDQRIVAKKLLSKLQGEYLKKQADEWKELRICNVTCHEPSGHLHVVIRVGMEMEEHGKLSKIGSCSTPSAPSGNEDAIHGDRDGDAKTGRQLGVVEKFISSTWTYLKENDGHDISPPYRITVRSIPSDVSGSMPQVHWLYCKYQHAIHGDDDPYTSQDIGEDECASFTPAKKSSEMHRDSVNDDDPDMDENDLDDDDSKDGTKKMKKEYFTAIYPEYNKHQIQKIYENYSSFQRFLCASPLPRQAQHTGMNFVKSPANAASNVNMNPTQTENPHEHDPSGPFHIQDSDVIIPYGSYHQHYLINDKYLFAVGVVDILPHCLSSVYAFYDPELSRILNLGKITALYEIEWVKRAMEFRPDLRYYYLGYYIHSCQKMKYKAQFKPSELLCPVRGVWVDFEEAEKRLDERSPIRHCCNISTPDEQYFGNNVTTLGNEDGTKKYKDEKSKQSVVNNIMFDIGAGRYLNMNMVTEEAREIIYPLLESLVEEVGADIALQCIVKLF